MRASELIEKLKEQMERYGDPVVQVELAESRIVRNIAKVKPVVPLEGLTKVLIQTWTNLQR